MSDSLATSKEQLAKLEQDLKAIAESCLQKAKQLGATSAEVSTSTEAGYGVNVRMGEVETVEYHRGKGVSVVTYFGKRKGSASSSDTSAQGLTDMVSAACDIAQATTEDEYAGLAEPELMAKTIQDLDLYHPWALTVSDAIDMVLACESKGLNFDKRIKNSDGAGLSTYAGVNVYANSHDFCVSVPSTRHSASCVLIAEDDKGMQRDYDFTVARDSSELVNLEDMALVAAKRTVERLGARQIATCQVPVLFSAKLAGGLLGSFISAVSGGNLYRKTSFLLDHLGQQVFPERIKIYEQPHLLKALGSAAFDSEGVATTAKDFVEHGILKSYVLGSYSARKLGLKTTANADGVHNLQISHDDLDLAALIKKMDRGLLVTELMGQGTNIVTGDYSRGAGGFWVEHGAIQYPVEEVTIAGNLRDMFMNIQAIGNDIDKRGNICSGSILIDPLTVAGC